MSLETAIARNRARWAKRRRWSRIYRDIAWRIFDYEDAGKEEKARRVMDKCLRVLKAI